MNVYFRAAWVLLRTRRVVQYNAVDHEHGSVEIEVRANRLTGRCRRYIFPQDDP